MRGWSLGVALAMILVLSTAAFGMVAVAQDATPATGDCPTTTVEENIALVEAALAAVEAGDFAAFDAALSDDHTDNITAFGVEDDPATNEDEFAEAMVTEGIFPGSEIVIDAIYGFEDKVIVEGTFTVTAHMLTGQRVELDAAVGVDLISIFTIECGAIARQHSVTDGAALLTALGVLPGFEETRIATPEA